MKTLLPMTLITMILLTSCSQSKKTLYPPTKRVAQVDDYFGTKVPDPYRWLEDDRSDETAKWVQAQNAVTFTYLDRIPFRNALHRRLTEIYNYPR